MSIGGYLGLELNKKQNNLLDDRLLFNTGRSACIYYLRESKVSKIWVPYYICGDFIETLRENGFKIEFYTINSNFEVNQEIPKEDYLIYVNYFGIKDEYIFQLVDLHKNIIVDNSQALFNEPVYSHIPTFYSPRKFLGVPDGGLLSMNVINQNTFSPIRSFDSASHLLKQKDIDTEFGFLDFKLHEKKLIKSGVKGMSNISKKIIESIDIQYVKNQRIKNYSYLESHLKNRNSLVISNTSTFSYPLLVENGEDLKAFLIKKKIYTPTLWQDQLENIDESSVEYNYIKNIVHLPIDQRYNENEMFIIIKAIKDYYG